MDVREKPSNEKRLIDADRAMEIVRNQGIAHPNAYHLTNYATLILREAPTVDAVEVVRCRECKHRYTENCPMYFHDSYWHDGYFDYIDYDTDNTEDDYFCPKGEQEEGAD